MPESLQQQIADALKQVEDAKAAGASVTYTPTKPINATHDPFSSIVNGAEHAANDLTKNPIGAIEGGVVVVSGAALLPIVAGVASVALPAAEGITGLTDATGLTKHAQGDLNKGLKDAIQNPAEVGQALFGGEVVIAGALTGKKLSNPLGQGSHTGVPNLPTTPGTSLPPGPGDAPPDESGAPNPFPWGTVALAAVGALALGGLIYVASR